MDIVALERRGLSPEAMRTHYSSPPSRTTYYDYKDEIDACIEDDRQWDEGYEERRDEFGR